MNRDDDMYDIIIVGCGPAGMTAALYARRANKKVLVFEAKAYGGQIINAHMVKNYPGIHDISGFDYATLLYNQIKELDCEIKYEAVIRIEDDNIVVTNKDKYQAKSIILATGAVSKKMNIAREDDFIGKGISYCATCDGNFYKDKDVCVYGGDNTALEDALYLSDIASNVYLINKEDKFIDNILLDEINNKDNIHIITVCSSVELRGDENLTGIRLSSDNTISISGLFIVIGNSPKNEIFKNIIDIDKDGYIISSDGVHTSKPKIYVAGDNRVKKLRQLVTACSDGAIAATTAIMEMNDNG